ncbi:MAG: NADH-quinone oxidoreductase subunit N, partial [Deltaproteobacteria bacterium]|nr:NADH-quinone oxidoreductase subunit N [Deltaproteobacteria bacterium]
MITLPPINWLSLLPSLILTIVGILVLFWDLWMKDEERPLLAWLGLTGLVVTGVVSFALLGRNESAFNGMLALDSYALFFNLIFCLAAGMTLLMSVHYLDTADIRPGEYYALILFATVG